MCGGEFIGLRSVQSMGCPRISSTNGLKRGRKSCWQVATGASGAGQQESPRLTLVVDDTLHRVQQVGFPLHLVDGHRQAAVQDSLQVTAGMTRRQPSRLGTTKRGSAFCHAGNASHSRRELKNFAGVDRLPDLPCPMFLQAGITALATRTAPGRGPSCAGTGRGVPATRRTGTRLSRSVLRRHTGRWGCRQWRTPAV